MSVFTQKGIDTAIDVYTSPALDDVKNHLTALSNSEKLQYWALGLFHANRDVSLSISTASNKFSHLVSDNPNIWISTEDINASFPYHGDDYFRNTYEISRITKDGMTAREFLEKEHAILELNDLIKEYPEYNRDGIFGEGLIYGEPLVRVSSRGKKGSWTLHGVRVSHRRHYVKLSTLQHFVREQQQQQIADKKQSAIRQHLKAIVRLLSPQDSPEIINALLDCSFVPPEYFSAVKETLDGLKPVPVYAAPPVPAPVVKVYNSSDSHKQYMSTLKSWHKVDRECRELRAGQAKLQAELDDVKADQKTLFDAINGFFHEARVIFGSSESVGSNLTQKLADWFKTHTPKLKQLGCDALKAQQLQEKLYDMTNNPTFSLREFLFVVYPGSGTSLLDNYNHIVPSLEVALEAELVRLSVPAGYVQVPGKRDRRIYRWTPKQFRDGISNLYNYGLTHKFKNKQLILVVDDLYRKVVGK